MRSRIFARRVAPSAVARSPLLLSSCYDGPNQPYSVAPNGAGQRWNDGKTPGSVSGAGQPFQTNTGGTNLQEICTPDERHRRTSMLIEQPIMPPRKVANL